MAVQPLGGEWVSSAAYDFVKAQNFEKSNANEVLKDLSNKFTNLKINIGTQAGGSGLNNLTIAPNILQEMATNQEAREKYEAIIYDMNEIAKNPQTTTMTGAKIIASGFMINADGTTGGWAISESGSDEKSALEKLLESLEEKRKERELEEAKRQDKKQGEVSIQITTKSLLDIES